MRNIVTYMIIFILFSILGWIYEYHFFGKDGPDNISRKIFNVDMAILPIYGIGGILLYYIVTNYKNLSILHRTIIATLIISIFECMAGQLSYWFNGKQTWKYDDHMMPTCSGYISVGTSLWWMILIYIMFYIFDSITR